MPKYRYHDTVPRLYPSLSLEVEHGDVVELKRNPDPARFSPVKPPAKRAAKKPAAKPAKSTPDPEVTE